MALEFDPAVALIADAARLLVEVTPGSGREGAALRRAAADIEVRAEALLRSGSFGAASRDLFAASRAAGATLDGLQSVHDLADAGGDALRRAVALGLRRLALTAMAGVVAETTLRSREDVATLTARLNRLFGESADEAADSDEHEVYRRLIALHAAVTRDLNQRAKPLPRMVGYRFARSMPALALSNRLYGAGDRADELVAENKAVHPLFMPVSGRALSV